MSVSKALARFIEQHPNVDVTAMQEAFAAHFPGKQKNPRKTWHHVRQCEACFRNYRGLIIEAENP